METLQNDLINAEWNGAGDWSLKAGNFVIEAVLEIRGILDLPRFRESF